MGYVTLNFDDKALEVEYDYTRGVKGDGYLTQDDADEIKLLDVTQEGQPIDWLDPNYDLMVPRLARIFEAIRDNEN